MKEKEPSDTISKKTGDINIPRRYLGVIFFAVALIAYKIYSYYTFHVH
jgi:hypothetical protein